MHDKTEGKGEELKGKVNEVTEEAGKLGGTWDQAKGQVKEGVGDVKINATNP